MNTSPKTLAEAKEIIDELATALEKAAQASGSIATVIAIDQQHVLLGTTQGIREAYKPAFDVEIGDQVVAFVDTGQIARKTFKEFHNGSLETVKTAAKKGELTEINFGGGTRFVSTGKFDVKVGDRVTLDHSGTIIVTKNEAELKPTMKSPGVKWSDVGGQEEAKREMREAIEFPHLYPKMFAHYNKRIQKGIVLEGPPGCGKTTLAKAVATSLSEDGDLAGFIFVKGPEILDPYVGVAEQNVRAIFHRAREYTAKTGKTAVIFIDESEAILGNRNGFHNQMERTIVPAFLAEMDGIEDLDAVIILATNHISNLDPAIVRDSRMDRKITVGRPNKEECKIIAGIHLRNIPTVEKKDVLIDAAIDELFNPRYAFADVEVDDLGKVRFSLSNMVSGALIEGIFEKASAIAMRRDIENNKLTGVSLTDVKAAIQLVYNQNRKVNHDDAIRDFAGGRRVVSLKKVAIDA